MARQRQQLNARLGIDPQFQFGLELTEIVTSEDLNSCATESLPARYDALGAVSGIYL